MRRRVVETIEARTEQQRNLITLGVGVTAAELVEQGARRRDHVIGEDRVERLVEAPLGETGEPTPIQPQHGPRPGQDRQIVEALPGALPGLERIGIHRTPPLPRPTAGQCHLHKPTARRCTLTRPRFRHHAQPLGTQA